GDSAFGFRFSGSWGGETKSGVAPCESLRFSIPDRSSGPGQIGQAHLRVFPREDRPVRTGLERGGCRGIGVVARSLAAVLASGDADINSRENFASALHTQQRPLRLAKNIIWRQPGAGEVVVVFFV